MGLSLKLGKFVAEVDAEVNTIQEGGGLFSRPGGEGGGLFSSNKSQTKDLLKKGGLLALGGMAKTIKSITETIKKPAIFGTIKGMISDFLGSIGDTILFGLILFVDFLWKKLKEFGNWLLDGAGKFWDWIAGTEHDFWGWLSGGVSNIGDDLMNWLTEGISDVGDKFWNWLSGGITDAGDRLWEWLQSETADLWSWMTGGLSNMGFELWNWITDNVTGIVDAAKVLVIDMAESAAELWVWLQSESAELWTWITGGLSNIGDGLWEWISGGFKSLAGGASSAAAKVAEKAKNVGPGSKFVEWIKGGSPEIDPGGRTFEWLKGGQVNRSTDFWGWITKGLDSPGPQFVKWVIDLTKSSSGREPDDESIAGDTVWVQDPYTNIPVPVQVQPAGTAKKKGGIRF